MSQHNVRIACCMTSHGLGHAARACAVMEALAARLPVHFEIFSATPAWFVAESLTASYVLHSVEVDVGLVQQDPLAEDLERSLARLRAFEAQLPELVNWLAVRLRDCQLVLCDIAGAGIAAAELARTKFGARIRSVLMENFTWDWICDGYAARWPEFGRHGTWLRQLGLQADFRVRTEPVCGMALADLLTPPIARPRRQDRNSVRRQLLLGDTDRAVLVTMGGTDGGVLPLERMEAMRTCCFVVAGQNERALTMRGNLRLLPRAAGIWHPDLVAACDAVVGKLGYSTLAEVFQAGVPFGHVSRPHFRESEPLAAFVARNMPSLAIAEPAFRDGTWLDLVPELLSLRPRVPQPADGASVAADFLSGLLV